MLMSEKISIICPKCKKVMGKTKNDYDLHKLMCKNCKKWIWFIPKLNYYKIKEVPNIRDSGAKRFF